MAKIKRKPKTPHAKKAAKQKAPLKNPFEGKPWLPHVLVLVAALVLLLAYFSPALSGKILQQGDIKQVASMGHEASEYYKETGKQAFWSESMFGGMPTVAAGMRHHNNWFRKTTITWYRLVPRPASQILLMFIGFYVLMNVLKMGPWLSGIGALAFAFSSYFFIIMEAGHNTKATAIAFMPLVLSGVLLAYTKSWWKGAILTAVAVAFEVSANHPQITYYLIICLFTLGVTFFIDALLKKTLNNFFIASGVLVFAGLLGVLPASAKLMMLNEYGKHTIRYPSELSALPGQVKTDGLDQDYAFGWSYGVEETFTLMFPNFHGGASATEFSKDSEEYKKFKQERLPTYFGSQPFTSGPVYAGAIICFLFIFGLFLVEGPVKWWLLTASILAIMLSWGKNFMFFNEFVFNHLPMYSKFRAVSMNLVIVEMTFPILATLGLHRLIKGEALGISKEKMLKGLYIAAGVTLGLGAVFYLMGPLGVDFITDRDVENYGKSQGVIPFFRDMREGLFKADILRSMGFIAVAAGLIWLYIKDKLTTAPLLGVIALLIVIDMWGVNKRYVNDKDFGTKSNYAAKIPTPTDKAILKDKDLSYRVLNLISDTYNEANTGYFHKAIGGYSPVKLRRYQDLIERKIGSLRSANQKLEVQRLGAVLRKQPSDSILQRSLSQLPVLNMLNSRYIIINPKGAPLYNRHALGNAWLVAEYDIVENADAEMAALGTFDPARKAVIDKRFSEQLQGWNPQFDPSASVRLTAYSPNKLTYESNASSEQLAIFSEIYYRGGKDWKAYIDGEEKPHFRTNYVLRGMRIPAGKHTIEFVIDSPTYHKGETFSLIGSILILFLGLGGLFLFYKEKTAKPEETSKVEDA